MYPQNDHHIYELHRLRIEEATAAHKHIQPDKNNTTLLSKVNAGSQFIGRLRHIRVQVTFEVAEPRPEGC
ncbi:MAG: hypothetical protein GY796_30755 [Chloroflexi bacterium]|nr:hypothetical protein [Chloroflexota bacterium]